MKQFEIIPHIGIGPIKFGMSKSEVKACFGDPEFEGDGRFGFFSGFMVDFDEEGKVEFIELANSVLFEATYKGKNLHKLKTSSALSWVQLDDLYDDDTEAGHSFIFKELQLSLWRSSVPENDKDEDGQYFEAVGIATNNYFE